MKIIYIIFLFNILPFFVNGQSDKIEIALTKIENYATQHKIAPSDYSNYIISDQYTTKDGLTHIYFHQTVDNIPIEGAITTVTITSDDEAIMVGDAYVNNAKNKIANPISRLTPTDAVNNALRDLGMQPTSSVYRSKDGISHFAKVEGIRNEIKAQKIFYYDYKKDQLILTYKTNLDDKSPEYYSYYIDASTGAIVSKENQTIHCKFNNHTSSNEHSGHVHSTECLSSNRLSLQNIIQGQTATYNVYPLPAESPSETAQVIVDDAQYPESSPFGWHDTNGQDGAEYTITRGNNVHAYLDVLDDGKPKGDEPDGGETLEFNYTYKDDVSIKENKDLAVTNLFYMTNMFHDITAKLGFDEEAGNFQNRNYSGKGRGLDEVRAESFDGSETAEFREDNINNANFLTLPDGLRPRMQMYLWRKKGIQEVLITSPEILKGYKRHGVAGFGKNIPDEDSEAIEGEVILAIDDTDNVNDACTAITNAEALNGNIALIDRGSCNFVVKVKGAQEAGAVAAIVCNVAAKDRDAEEVIRMGGEDDTIKIPSVFFAKSSCDSIKTEIEKNNKVFIKLQENSEQQPKYISGSFDNGIVLHENGHGISNRLIGGPRATNCMRSAQQAGEGISDFMTLLMTVKETDTREKVRTVGTYASDQEPTGRGIRPYPFSTDMTKNPLTFGDLTKIDAEAEGSQYPVGIIWTTMLWEMYWNFVDKYGMDPTFKDETKGNFMVGKLLVSGMKMSPCNPTFLEARNAIIESDRVLYNGDNRQLILNAFAKRGLGTKAKAWNTNSLKDIAESFQATGTITSLEDEKLAQEVIIYPNPAKDVINIDMTDLNLGNVDIELTGLSGRVLRRLSSKSKTETINVNGLSRGIYFVRITSKNGALTQKIIIQ